MCVRLGSSCRRVASRCCVRKSVSAQSNYTHTRTLARCGTVLAGQTRPMHSGIAPQMQAKVNTVHVLNIYPNSVFRMGQSFPYVDAAAATAAAVAAAAKSCTHTKPAAICRLLARRSSARAHTHARLYRNDSVGWLTGSIRSAHNGASRFARQLAKSYLSAAKNSTQMSVVWSYGAST